MAITKPARHLYQFGPFSVDVAERVLLRDGRSVALPPKAFDLLVVLVENSGHLLEKDELMQRLWPDTFVEEANLSNNISLLRKALATDQDHQYIETVPRRGYRFVADVEESSSPQDELIIAERTRITLEEEEEFDEVASDVKPVVGSNPSDIPTTLSSHRRFPLSKSTTAALVAGFVLLAVGSLALYVFLVRSRGEKKNATPLAPFQQMEIKRVAASGRAKGAAISPDGRYIAYVLAEDGLQSIHLTQVDTSSSVVIRPPTDGVYAWPIFSPDGRSLYYTAWGKDVPGGLYRSAVLGGVPQKVLTGHNSPIAFSPDGRRVAFMRFYPGGETAVVVADAQDGGAEQKLAVRKLPDKFSINGPSWSPDGKVIAICANDGNTGRAKVFGVRVSDGHTEALTEHEWSNPDRVMWLGEGNGLALIAAHKGEGDRRQIWHIAYPGGEVRRITNDLHDYEANNLTVSADSQSLVAVQIQTASNIWLLPAGDVTRARQLTFGPAGKLDGFNGLTFTPGGQIVYCSYVGNGQTIWIMNADGSNQRQLTPAAGHVEHSPSVTADGRYIVFHSTRSGALDIWRIDIDGGNPVKLTEGGSNYQPSVSPDGEWIVYKSLRNGVWSLWKAAIDGGTPVQLTDKTTSWPAISPDGKWIACIYDGHFSLVPFEGGPAKPIELPPNASTSSGPRWKPDSRSLIIRDANEGVWEAPIDGAPAVHLSNLGPERIFNLAWSPDGKQLALARGTQTYDVVLIRNFR